MRTSLGLAPRFMAVGLLAALTGVALMTAGMTAGMAASLAQQSPVEADQPLQVKLTTTLNAETAHYGDPFTGVLTEDYTLHGKSLPQGTVFKGHVQRARKSLPLGMPGYVVLDIDEAQLPSGVIHHFEQGKTAPKTNRIVNPSVKSRAAMLKDSSPYTAISTATSIPLRYAAGFNSWTIVPIALGSRIALGVAMHLKNHHQQALAQSSAKHSATSLIVNSPVTQGIVDGSGLNAAYYFLSTAPEPVLTEGTVLPLHFKTQDLNSLLSAADTAPAQAQPTASTRAQEPVTEPKAQSTVVPVSGQQQQQATLNATTGQMTVPGNQH